MSFSVVQLVKNNQETQIPFLGSEDPLEKGMVTHSSMFVWSTLCTGELGGLQSMGLQRVQEDSVTNTFSFTFVQCVFVTQSRPSLCDTMDSSPPGSCVHRTLQARIL